jgi:hypothetical protein
VKRVLPYKLRLRSKWNDCLLKCEWHGLHHPAYRCAGRRNRVRHGARVQWLHPIERIGSIDHLGSGQLRFPGRHNPPTTISGTGPFFIYLDASGENFEGADNIILTNGATPNNVFFYIPNGNVTIAGSSTTFGGTLIVGGTGTVTVENTSTIDGRILTNDQINLANFSNGPLLIDPNPLLAPEPEPSTVIFSGIGGVLFLLKARYARRKRSC